MRAKRGFSMVQLVVVVAIVALAGAILIPNIERARTQASLILCRDRLRQVGNELLQYSRLNQGRLPVSASLDGAQRGLLQSLIACQILGDPRDYYCPAQRQAKFCFSEEHLKAGVIGYYYYSALRPGGSEISKFLRDGVAWPRKLVSSMDPRTWVMSDIWISAEPTAHAGYRKGVNYLMLDGSVGFVGQSPRQAFH